MASKSFTVNTWLTLKLLQQNNTVLFTRFTLVSAKDSIIPEFNEKIELLNLQDVFDIQTHDITYHKNNSRILFRGIKTSQGIQTAKLKSLTSVNIWVLDEAEELAEEDIFDKIDLSVRAKGTKNIIILIMNPALRTHWIYKRFFNGLVPENFNGVKDNITYIYTTLEDNIENIDEDLLNELLELKEKDPEKYKKRMATSWLDESEDIVFNLESLNRFKEVDYKNAEVAAYCDVADQGIDYLCFVVGALIGENIFIIDVLFTQRDSNYSIPAMMAMFEKYNISRTIFESNAMGAMYSKSIKDKLSNKYRISAKNNSTNKHSRIIMQADYILDNFYFKEAGNDMYKAYINNLASYRYDKSFKIDDAPDATAGLSRFIRKVILK